MPFVRRSPLSSLARKVQRALAALLPGEGAIATRRLGIAVSGGADSVALVRAMIELRDEMGFALSVVHVNHGLRGAESDADECFVRELVHAFGVEFYCERADVRATASEHGKGLEAAAREVRYRYFRTLIASAQVDCILTAHTLDDQAETVLLRILRGTGMAGLRGIHSALDMAGPDGAPVRGVLRPMLGVSRAEVEAYLRDLGQSWREDSSNRDVSFTRNRVRHELMPLLEAKFNPDVKTQLSELAAIAADEEEWIAPQVAVRWRNHAPLELPVDELRRPKALSRRILKAVGSELGIALRFEQVEELLGLVDAAPGRVVELSGWRVERTGDALRFLPVPGEIAPDTTASADYVHALPLPGEIRVPEAGCGFRVEVLEDEASGSKGDVGLNGQPSSTQRCLIPWEQAQKGLTVRNWRAGDRFHAAFSKGPKKVKELLQAMHLAPEAKASWPVILCGEELVWGRGFPPSASSVAAEKAGKVVVITEVGWDG